MRFYSLFFLFPLLALMTLAAPQYARADISTGLVGHWTFDGNTQDSSGQGNHGTAVGDPTFTAGKLNQALSFDGMDDYVNVGSAATLDQLPVVGDITISAWIKADTLGDNNLGTIISKAANNRGWNFLLDSVNSLEFTADHDSGDLFVRTTNNSTPLNQWFHVVATWDGSTTANNVHIYQNGVELGYASQQNASGSYFDDSIYDVIIGDWGTHNRHFDGLIDDVRVYNRVLSASDVAELFNFTGSPQCSDGLDNDGDGLTDYPNDTGCTSSSDNDETNPDTIEPTIPTNFSATAVSSSRIDLSWTASTDSGGSGLAGYRVERCQGSSCSNFSEIAQSTTNSYSNTGLSASTLYRYRVRAVDNANNFSSYSTIAQATTQSPPVDATPPIVSINSPINGSSVQNPVTITANASDNVEVQSVQFFVDGSSVGSDTTAPYSIQVPMTLVNGSHTTYARATDTSNNQTTSATISFNVSSTPPPATCGNNIVEAGEACDGTNLNGLSCSSIPGYKTGGTLTCKADCSGYNVSQCMAGNTINAASCSQADVQTAVNSAQNGDTVRIPAGTCSWSTPVTLNNKFVTLMGAGIDVTTITTSGKALYIVASQNPAPFRITGFTLTGTNPSETVTITSIASAQPVTGWRIDHMRFNYSGAGLLMPIKGITWGLMDHLTFDGNSYEIAQFHGDVNADYGVPNPLYGAAYWNRLINLGTNEAVYFEDLDINFNGTGVPVIFDLVAGGSAVLRYSNIEGNYFITHSARSGDRGGMKYEVYNNTFDGKGFLRVSQLRSGTGVIFNNTINNYTDKGFTLDNQRCSLNSPPLALCNGASPYDGNAESNGWPCLDQIGRGGGAPLSQPSEPLYTWNNGITATCATGGACSNNSVAYVMTALCSNMTDWIRTTSNPHIGGVVDYINNGSTPKPGYVPYVYPHPLAILETTPPSSPQCSDSLDNDFDGLTDYPNDPGCSSASDNNETNTSTPLVGDLNQDGTVNALDWGIMNSQWFTNNPQSDINSDGLVNSIDFGLMNQNWGLTSS